MLLTIDVGNTSTKLGLTSNAGGGFDQVWSISTNRDRTSDEWHALLGSLVAAGGTDLAGISGVGLASVVPAVTRWLTLMSRDRLGIEPVVLVSHPFPWFRVETDQPQETGVDRVVSAFAAYAAYGGPTVVVDAGTATKVDAVSADGAFLGGVIAPGIGTMLEALAGRAARLYAVEPVPPPAAIGRNTVAALQSGVVLGYLELCAGMIRRVQAELGGTPRVIVTGGGGALIAQHLPNVEVYDPLLTLQGVALAYRLQAAQPAE
jgi:type III pantothenate kinase